MTPLSRLSWRIPECATNAFDWPDGFRDMWLMAPATLVVNTFHDLLVFDASEPLNIRLLHREKTRIDRIVRTRLCGTALVCCGDEGVLVLDLARPAAPTTIARLPHKKLSRQVHSGWLVDHALYVPGGLGVERLDLATGVLAPAGTAPGVERTDAYAGDVLVNDTHVVTTCHDYGVQIWERRGSDLHHVKGWNANTSSHLTWDTATGGDAAFFDVGETDALARFALAKKPTKQKLWKTAKTWLAPQVVRRGDEILTAGIRHPDKGELDILVGTTSGTGPAAVSKARIKGFVSREQRSDAMRGLVAVGDVLLASSYARRLYAVVGEPTGG